MLHAPIFRLWQFLLCLDTQLVYTEKHLHMILRAKLARYKRNHFCASTQHPRISASEFNLRQKYLEFSKSYKFEYEKLRSYFIFTLRVRENQGSLSKQFSYS